MTAAVESYWWSRKWKKLPIIFFFMKRKEGRAGEAKATVRLGLTLTSGWLCRPQGHNKMRGWIDPDWLLIGWSGWDASCDYFPACYSLRLQSELRRVDWRLCVCTHADKCVCSLVCMFHRWTICRLCILNSRWCYWSYDLCTCRSACFCLCSSV